MLRLAGRSKDYSEMSAISSSLGDYCKMIVCLFHITTLQREHVDQRDGPLSGLRVAGDGAIDSRGLLASQGPFRHGTLYFTDPCSVDLKKYNE